MSMEMEGTEKEGNVEKDIRELIKKKQFFFENVIQHTYIHLQKYNPLSKHIDDLHNIHQTLLSISSNDSDSDTLIDCMQQINRRLSVLFQHVGTDLLEDLLWICIGSYTFADTNFQFTKFPLLKQYFHPTGYKVIHENNYPNLWVCEDVSLESFALQTHGIQLSFPNKSTIMCITGILDNIPLSLLNVTCFQDIPSSKEFQTDAFQRYIKSLTLKDYLVIKNTHDLCAKYIGMLSQWNAWKQKPINAAVKEFLNVNLYEKRNLFILLLLNGDKMENLYLANMLYDLMSSNGNETSEQLKLIESLPWEMKRQFQSAKKNAAQYILQFDIQKMPLEQQICLMNANEFVKEKAMQKWKELKSKNEDGGSKARQYLEGLLKIPFGVYKREPILNIMNIIREKCDELGLSNPNMSSVQLYLGNNKMNLNHCSLDDIKQMVIEMNKRNKDRKIKLNISRKAMIQELEKWGPIQTEKYKKALSIQQQWTQMGVYLSQIRDTLDAAIYGHDKAKTQLERIIGQWMNGKQTGYCFGFEGPAGVGKTTLAKKGLANCLKDENGEPRPFSMIQIGGSANGSILHGHHYTYLSATWGSIAQILMDKQCMNPIIFIDEVDKISGTENGKELIGILTHLLDPAQNDCFQDRYFSGVDLDLSKALFILSYNDASLLDSIMLDRIHRISFKSLSVAEKLIICRRHLLPEIMENMGLPGAVQLEDNVLTFIIEEYTFEPGVRKLKEILFEIIGEINLEILKGMPISIPCQITKEQLKTKYLKQRREVKCTKIHTSDSTGVVNGLWANVHGKGGIIQIQTSWRPCEDFLQLFLTGMQGDVMKESMNVALTLAWNLTPKEIQQTILNSGKKGIHIHCPEGATPKDGPSAGTAITIAIYSLFNGLKIRHDVAITGEIQLDGKVTEIGGLEAKIEGGIKAGVTTFLYPEENKEDFDKIMDNKSELKSNMLDNIQFHAVNRIEEVFALALAII
jgi:ATP-dependent Lon protease